MRVLDTGSALSSRDPPFRLVIFELTVFAESEEKSFDEVLPVVREEGEGLALE